MQNQYSLPDFINIVSNFKPVQGSSNLEKIEQYKTMFTFLDEQASICYFIHDFNTYTYLLVSKSLKIMTGYNHEILLGKNFGDVLQHYIHPDDANNLRFIHEKMFDHFYKEPIDERHKLRFDFNFRFRKISGEWLHVLQQTIYIVFTEEGNPLYDFSTCTDISAQKRNNRLELTIYKKNNQEVYEPVLEFFLPETTGYDLTKRESEILIHISQGMSSKEIADKCCVSLHTINSHRKNILSKTSSKNFSEAIIKANIQYRETINGK